MADWSAIGAEAGSWRTARVGSSSRREDADPPHVHGEAEEIFFVLGGSGLTWMDESDESVRATGSTEDRHEAHTILAAAMTAPT